LTGGQRWFQERSAGLKVICANAHPSSAISGPDVAAFGGQRRSANVSPLQTVHGSVHELLLERATDASDDKNHASKSGYRTVQSVHIGGLLISGFGVRVPGGAPCFSPMILGPLAPVGASAKKSAGYLADRLVEDRETEVEFLLGGRQGRCNPERAAHSW
jgi:hypothetical protein